EVSCCLLVPQLAKRVLPRAGGELDRLRQRPEWRRLEVVTCDVPEHRIERVAMQGLERRTGISVQLGAHLGTELGDERILHERVREAKAARPLGALLDHAQPTRRLQLAADV